MEQTLHALGGLLLKALPTFFLVILLYFYLKYTFFRPMQRLLRQRYEMTEGTRKLAESSLAKAAEKAAEYEAALRAARSEIYREQEQMRAHLQEENSQRLREARRRAEQMVEQAKAELAAEVGESKQALMAEAESIAEEIATAVLHRRAA